MNDTASTPHEIMVVGAGMVAHRFVESLLSRADADVRVTVIGDEGRGPYDRVGLTSFFSGATPDDLELDRAVFRDARVRLIHNDRVLRIDRSARSVRTRSRRNYDYDTLVLATGSYAARVAVDGADLPGCFVYRTLDDVQSLRDFVAARTAALGLPPRCGHRRRPVGARGGGCAAGDGRRHDGRAVLGPPDVGAARSGGRGMLKRLLESRGITVRTQARTTRLDPDESGAVTALEFQDGSFQRADVVVFTVGVRPRDELARNAELEVHPRGGVLIDERCSTSDPNILAIGEVANFDDRCVGLVAPGYAMAEVAATRLLGGEASFPGYDESAKLKLSGVDVASFGDALARTPDALDVVYADPVAACLQEARALRRCADPARRHPRRRCQRLWLAAPPRGGEARRRPVGLPPAGRAMPPRSGSFPTKPWCARAPTSRRVGSVRPFTRRGAGTPPPSRAARRRARPAAPAC